MVILVEDLRLKFVLQNRGTLELCSFVLEEYGGVEREVFFFLKN